MQLRPAELPRLGGLDLPAEDLAAELHAVADAEDGDAEIEDRRIAFGGVRFVNAARAAGEDDAFGVEPLDFFGRDIRANELAIDALLAHSPGD